MISLTFNQSKFRYFFTSIYDMTQATLSFFVYIYLISSSILKPVSSFKNVCYCQECPNGECLTDGLCYVKWFKNGTTVGWVHNLSINFSIIRLFMKLNANIPNDFFKLNVNFYNNGTFHIKAYWIFLLVNLLLY